MKSIVFLLGLISYTTSAQQFIQPEGLIKPASYTHVVVAGNTVYISGQVSANEKGEVVGKGDLKAQVTRVYENLAACLKAAGVTFNDVVKMNTYVVNFKPEDLGVIRDVRKNYLSADHPPASTLVGVQALASPDWMVEIEAIAIKK
jgi:enamine deaminase RidA (YjgF/YER057c/UK114 family)